MTSSPPRGRSMCPAEFICDLKRNLGMSPNKHLDGTSCFDAPLRSGRCVVRDQAESVSVR